MDKQVSHDDTCMLAKLPVSHWKPLFSLPNRTDMGHGGNLTSWHRACSVESMFFFFAITCPRCRITQLYLFAYFNHWGGNPLPAVTTAWIQARQMNRMEYSGSWSNLMLLVFSSIMKCRQEVARGSQRLPEDPAGFQTVPQPYKLAQPQKFSLCFQWLNIPSITPESSDLLACVNMTIPWSSLLVTCMYCQV